MSGARRWTPAAVLGVAALFTVGISTQRTMPLREPLARAIPDSLAGLPGHEIALDAAEVRSAGMTSYLMRTYGHGTTDSAEAFSLYVGYYAQQMQGHTIHSPKNCLPGAGWEALTATEVVIPTGIGPVPVNKYLVQNGKERALVLYWYQGRGHVAANEYLVKWNLLRDAALRQRSEEALVRIVVPVTTSEDSAFTVARGVAERVAPDLARALPS
ncbi:MAG TPA: EpsI family protein [Gemmatimonadales bacterium]|nr:EpsI family protein [Gemmatimonadales bacterium]